MQIIYEVDPSEKDTKRIYEGLVEFNIPIFGDMLIENFGCFIRDDKFEIIGGITGYIAGKIAMVKYVWVDKSIRGQGYGHKLFTVLENTLKQKQIDEMHLDTYTFQAPEFYTKLGFIEVARYTMMKKEKIEKIFFIKELS